jgi:HSP20 family protein
VAVAADEPVHGGGKAATDTAALEGEGLAGVDKELEALFQEFFRSHGSVCKTATGVWRPPTDVFETADHVVVKMEVAGVRKEDLDVTFEEHCLRIRGRRDERFTGKKVAVSQMEVEYGVFERNISIPHPVDADRIEATYADGFLLIRIAKRRPRRGSVVPLVL